MNFRVFYSKPSNLGAYPYFWKHPYTVYPFIKAIFTSWDPPTKGSWPFGWVMGFLISILFVYDFHRLFNIYHICCGNSLTTFPSSPNILPREDGGRWEKTGDGGREKIGVREGWGPLKLDRLIANGSQGDCHLNPPNLL